MTKRLTDAEIEDCLSEVDTTLKLRYVDKMFARAVESAVLERSKAEPVYQVAMVNGPANTAWIDVDEATYTSARLIPNEYKTRALYTAPQAVNQQLLDLLKLAQKIFMEKCVMNLAAFKVEDIDHLTAISEAIAAAELGEA